MKKETYRKILLFWTLFIGLGAAAGGTGMLMDPTGKSMGMDAMLPYFQVLPFAELVFQDFVFSGIMLWLVNGVTQLITAYLLLRRRAIAANGAIICGVLLMAWICIQFYMFPFNFMSTSYFIFGALEAACGLMYKRAERE